MKCSKLFPVLFFLWGYLNLSFTQPNIYWSKVYDGGSFDDTRFMVKDSQGNYIVTGTSVVSDPGYTNYGVLTIKYDSLGNQKWLKIKDNPNNAMDDATGLLVDDSNDVYVSGTFGGTFFLVKYDNSGNEKWFKQFNAYFSDYTVLNKHICLDDDENIYFSTVTLNAGQRHSAIRKYSSQGELIWLKEFTDLGSTHNEPINIVYDGAAFLFNRIYDCD